MSDEYKYGVAVHIYKPLIKRGVVDFAVGADWTPAAGDVKISIDGGAPANVTNLPSAITMGNTAMWDFSLTSGELTGKKIRITVADAATKAVEDQFFEIDTYGHASAQKVVDFTDGVRMALSCLPNVAVDAAGGIPATALSALLSRMTLGVVTTAGFSPTATAFEFTDTEATANHYIGQAVYAYKPATALFKQCLGVITASSSQGGGTRTRLTLSPGSPTLEALASADTVLLV